MKNVETTIYVNLDLNPSYVGKRLAPYNGTVHNIIIRKHGILNITFRIVTTPDENICPQILSPAKFIVEHDGGIRMWYRHTY